MVLFLTRSNDRVDEWQSAMLHFEHRWPIDFSVVWVEGQDAYAVQQPRNPGPNALVALDGGLAKLKSDVIHFCDVQTRLRSAGRIKDLTRRAAALREFAVSESWHARREAFAALADCGTAAVPVLRGIINDDRLTRHHGTAITSMGDASGKEATPFLIELIQDETAFWKETAPQLPVDWWNDGSRLGWDEVEMLRTRYGRLKAALQVFETHPYVDEAVPVQRLRDLWRSFPQLDE